MYEFMDSGANRDWLPAQSCPHVVCEHLDSHFEIAVDTGSDLFLPTHLVGAGSPDCTLQARLIWPALTISANTRTVASQSEKRSQTNLSKSI